MKKNRRTYQTGRMKKHRYSNEFKVTAVKMSNYPSILTQDVAKALNIHPFMLSRWKKEYREGTLKGKSHPNMKEIDKLEKAVGEQKRIRTLETALKKAQMENDLLKKAIQFNLRRNQRSSSS
jgi:transposase